MRRRRAPSSGSTAGTTRRPASPSPTAFAELEERDPRPLVLIAGMLNTKDQAGFFRPFAGLARHVDDRAGAGQRGRLRPGRRSPASPWSADVPARAFAERRAPRSHRCAQARREARPPRILICGSLYLAGSGAEGERPAAGLDRWKPSDADKGSAGPFDQAAAFWIHFCRSLFGPAPTFMSTGSPFLNMISVGMERTP